MQLDSFAVMTEADSVQESAVMGVHSHVKGVLPSGIAKGHEWDWKSRPSRSPDFVTPFSSGVCVVGEGSSQKLSVISIPSKKIRLGSSA